MNHKTYKIVGLDGREYENIEYRALVEWYAAKFIKEESLIFDPEIGEWKKLANVFNLAEFNAARNFRAQQNAANQQTFYHQQSFNDSANYNYQHSYASSFAPPENFNQSHPKSSSGVKIAIGAIIAVILVFGGMLAVLTYLYGEIVRTQVSKKGSEAKREEFLGELKKYEIPGKEYVDGKSGAKILLPQDWRRLRDENPFLLIYNRSESDAELQKEGISETRMLATDELANKVLLAEIINFPQPIDNSAFFNQSTKLIEQELVNQSKPGSYKRINELTIPLKNGLARKIVFERVSKIKNTKMEEFGLDNSDVPLKGQIIVLSKDYHAVVLQMWTRQDYFDEAIADFDFIETNFSMPNPQIR